MANRYQDSRLSLLQNHRLTLDLDERDDVPFFQLLKEHRLNLGVKGFIGQGVHYLDPFRSLGDDLGSFPDDVQLLEGVAVVEIKGFLPLGIQRLQKKLRLRVAMGPVCDNFLPQHPEYPILVPDISPDFEVFDGWHRECFKLIPNHTNFRIFY